MQVAAHAATAAHVRIVAQEPVHELADDHAWKETHHIDPTRGMAKAESAVIAGSLAEEAALTSNTTSTTQSQG